jgi:molecular chaperone GrpE
MTRSWWDNELLIRRLRDWLSLTEDEIDTLDDEPLHDGAEAEVGAAGSSESGGPQLAEGQGDRGLRQRPSAPSVQPLPEVGLLPLVEAFTALRHELKLQTKGTRGLEAAVEQSLAGLDAASRAMQSVQSNEQDAAQRAALPLVEALIGLDEALLRAAAAFQAAQRQTAQSASDRLREQLDRQLAQQSWWRRRTAGAWHAQLRDTACAALAQSTGEALSGLLDGLRLVQARLAQAMEKQGIRRLDATGSRVDPKQMTVVELVDDSDAAPETVVDVVRPGYAWNERIVRFAEVRAVASRGSLGGEPPSAGDAPAGHRADRNSQEKIDAPRDSANQ